MTDEVNWIDFQIVSNKSKYKHSEPIRISGKLQTGMVANVYFYIFYKNSSGNWIEPPNTHSIPSVATSNEAHTDNRTFDTSIQLNQFYPLGNYKLVAKYAEISCPIEPQFDLIT